MTESDGPAVKDRPARPKDLGDRAGALWDGVVGGFELRVDELYVLEAACREVDLIDRISGELDTAPLTVPGAYDQIVGHPLVSEVRQHRAAFATLIRQIKLPDAKNTQQQLDASSKARAAAMARWHRGTS